MSEKLTQSLGLNLSKDPETEGFDLLAGQTWIYPTNYPIREYQFAIVQKALLNNTLVSLPTGLGKTFIAAVVMYNFFRWYPMGKVIFMAPTRPLVKQQIDACYDIMAIPKEVTVELTGTKLVTSRGDVWKEKRVFFITPQILQNDLDRLEELGPKIKCLVFDEAHRARGNHAYCQVIRKLVVYNKFFRVLALSATPGSTINDVLEVVQNLLISHLEFRTEESSDVHPYVYERNLTTVVVPLGDKLQKVRDDYLQILEYYTKVLMKYKVIQGNCGSLTKGKIFMTMKEFQKNRTSSSANYAEIMKSLNICVTLYHAFELLTRHGLRSFLSFFTEHIDKPLLRGNTRLVAIMNDVKEYLGPEPNVEQLPDGSYPEVPKTVKFGHPKFYKLRDILVSHFTDADESSRVIVFFEYRNSVTEAYMLLIQAMPLLKPRIFLGQGQGVTQRLQLNVVKSFREGQCNILLSTCIGEEGLDVGDVDLIVCFDISNKSPIRMVQRMGRTGRKKQGHIIVLVTEGKEQQILKDCLIHKNNIAFHVLSSNELAKGLQSISPRLVPADISPTCQKMYITVKKPPLTKTSSLKEMFRTISSSSSEPTFSPDLEIVEIPERIPEVQMLWNKEDPLDKEIAPSSSFYKKIERQRSLQPTQEVGHSRSSEVLVELLQLVDSRRFNIPMTQIGTSSQLTQNLKQGDIRNMFLKSQVANGELLQASQVPKLAPPQPEESYLYESRELFMEISNYLTIQMSNANKRCKHCPDNFDCGPCTIDVPNVDFTWVQVEASILETVTLDDINLFTKSLTPHPEAVYDEFNDFVDASLITLTPHKQEKDIFDNLEITRLEKMAKQAAKNGDVNSEPLEEEPVEATLDAREKSYTYQAPKTLDSLLNRYSTSIIEIPDEKSQEKQTSTRNVVDSVEAREILSFFKVKSLSELFEDPTEILDSQETVVYSPDIFNDTFMGTKPVEETKSAGMCRQESEENIELSPVLGKFKKIQRMKDPSEPIRATPCRPNLQKLKVHNREKLNLAVDTPSKFTMNATKISSTPFKRKEHQSNFSPDRKQHGANYIEPSDSPAKAKPPAKVDVDDICDLSVFGLSPVKNPRTEPTPRQLTPGINENFAKQDQRSNSLFSSTSSPGDIDISDFCDLTSFGIGTQKNDSNRKEIDKLASPTKSTGTDLNEGAVLGGVLSPADLNSTIPLPGSSQTQLPITQLLSFINKDEHSPGTRTAVRTAPQEPSIIVKAPEGLTNRENTPKAKRKPNTNKTPRPTSSKARKNLRKSFNKMIFKNLLESTNSDDDFEERTPIHVFRKPAPITPQAGRKKIKQSSSSVSGNLTKKKKVNPFIEEEAELSQDENVHVSEDEEEEDQSVYDASFVADETQHVDSQMHAKYLQSLMSPNNRNKGQFKIPQRPKLGVANVYSQEVSWADETYLEDSFVVDEETEESHHELSQLEVLERKLREQRKKKKRKKSESDTEPAKRRKILILSDDSD